MLHHLIFNNNKFGDDMNWIFLLCFCYELVDLETSNIK
jgi:hypothetical protein